MLVTSVSTSDPTFQVGQSLFILPEALIGRVGQPLLIYCGPDNFTVFKDGVQLSPHISLVNITSITLDDAGIYTCQEVGVARSTTIFAIMPSKLHNYFSPRKSNVFFLNRYPLS